MVGTELSKELAEEAYRAIEAAKATGKITKGCNETTKALERGQCKLVAIAKDVSPPEVVMHLPALSKEKGVACVEVPSREELGAASGLNVKTTCVGIVKEGDAKKILASLLSQIGAPEKEEKAEEPEEAPEEKEAPAEDAEESKEEDESDKAKEDAEEPKAPAEESKEEKSE